MSRNKSKAKAPAKKNEEEQNPSTSEEDSSNSEGENNDVEDDKDESEAAQVHSPPAKDKPAAKDDDGKSEAPSKKRKPKQAKSKKRRGDTPDDDTALKRTPAGEQGSPAKAQTGNVAGGEELGQQLLAAPPITRAPTLAELHDSHSTEIATYMMDGMNLIHEDAFAMPYQKAQKMIFNTAPVRQQRTLAITWGHTRVGSASSSADTMSGQR